MQERLESQPTRDTLANGVPYFEQAPRVVFARPRPANASAHETASQDGLAREIARLFGWKFQPEGDDFGEYRHSHRPYYVPGDTLVDSPAQAGAAPPRIGGHDDLFGGMVPYPFVATKAITHALFDHDAQRPPGWSVEFGRRVQEAVLRGTTVFCIQDAHRAGAELLRHGPIRLKPVDGTAGRGQRLLKDMAALEAAIDECDSRALATQGLVLEEHLEKVATLSVGKVQIGSLLSTYVGTQSLTTDNTGASVYGGSDLRLAHGDFEALLALALTDLEREAIRLARLYDEAAMSCYRGLYASRRNYDIAHGRDAAGTVKLGVLEQSWRPGGASMAEVLALEAFLQQPQLRSVRAFTHERYGEAANPPRNARLTYRGDDEKVGFITKCAGIYSYDDR